MHRIQVAGRQIGVGGFRIGVDHEVQTIVLGRGNTLVIGVLDHLDVLVVVPLLELVLAVADRALAEGLRIVVERLRQRGVGGVADADREGRVRAGELDGEGGVVDHGQAGQLGVRIALRILQVLIALDDREEGGIHHAVGGVGGIAPGLGEGLGGHRGAVGEGPAVVQRDGVLGAVLVGHDLLGDLVLGVALVVEGDELGEQHIDRVAAAGLVGVGGDQRVLRLAAVHVHDHLAVGGVTVTALAAAAAQRKRQRAGRSRESNGFLLHKGFSYS